MKFFLLSSFICLSNINLMSQTFQFDEINGIFKSIFNTKKDIYLLGENDHEEKNTHKLKSELVVRAVNEKKIDLLIWESDFSESIAIYLNSKYRNSNKIDKQYKINAISKIWHSDFVKKMFDTLDFNQNSINFIGMDILPNSSLFNEWLYEELKQMGFKNLEEIDSMNQLIIHKTWSTRIDNIQFEKYLNWYKSFIKAFEKNKAKYTTEDYTLILHALENRIMLINYLTKDRADKWRYRDSCMAKNIQWTDSFFNSERKIIIWAHNGHISFKEELNGDRPAGSLLPQNIKDRALNVAISAPMVGKNNNAENPSIKFPSKSFESTYIGDKLYNMIYLNSKEFIENCKEQLNYTGGKIKTNLCEQYDAIIVFKEGYY